MVNSKIIFITSFIWIIAAGLVGIKELASQIGATEDTVINWEIRNIKPESRNSERVNSYFVIYLAMCKDISIRYRDIAEILIFIVIPVITCTVNIYYLTRPKVKEQFK